MLFDCQRQDCGRIQVILPSAVVATAGKLDTIVKASQYDRDKVPAPGVDFRRNENDTNVRLIMKILLVESDPCDAARVREAFGGIAETDFDVTPVDCLTAALDYLESSRPDLVLLDATLPDSEGFEGLERIRAFIPDTPIVLLVDSSDESFLISAISNGAQDYLVKSQLDAISLRRTLHCAFERKRWERIRREAALRESGARLRTVTDNIPALIAYVGVDQRFRFVNQYHEEWFGQRVAELTGKTMREVLGAEDYENCRHHVGEALHGQRVTFEQCMIRNSLERFLKITYIPEYEDSKLVVGFYILGHNVTESKLNEARLESIALYDALTGVANRLLLADRVSQAIAHAQRHSTAMALIYLDLDGFKQVNDTLGHDVGDLLLREVAERMVMSLRQEDTVARLGGDEFVIAGVGRDTTSLMMMVTPRIVILEEEESLLGIPQ